MVKQQELTNKNNEASTRNIERQIGQLSKQAVIERPTSSLPIDIIPNPKEECKAIQLRSGKTLVNDKKPTENDEASSNNDATLNKDDQEKPEEREKQPQISRKGKQIMEESSQGQKQVEKTFTPPLPYPQRFNKETNDQHFPKFLEELINKKRSWHEKEIVLLTEECSAMIQRGIPPKLKDPGSFVVSCTIGKMTLDKVLCDLGACINLMPLSMMRKLAIEELKPTRMSLVMADRSIKTLNGIVENLLVKVREFIFPANFVILDTEEEGNNSIILRRPFLATVRAIIDVKKGEMIFRVHNEQTVINVFKAMQYPLEQEDYMKVDMIESLVEEMLEANHHEQQKEEGEEDQETMEAQVAKISIEKEVKQDKKEEIPKQELSLSLFISNMHSLAQQIAFQ
ncbi:uncharacterized protein LOC130966210 [Arachis stenosperma]|uniref:uncharacterized protein LOC130966210 n=1 Tax=Arachis stenosperma TaxID=217475 RepID=UPI0025ABEA93|nr:uncharacterized protein LOC130966210 [Arachis stenosperma]